MPLDAPSEAALIFQGRFAVNGVGNHDCQIITQQFSGSAAERHAIKAGGMFPAIELELVRRGLPVAEHYRI